LRKIIPDQGIAKQPISLFETAIFVFENPLMIIEDSHFTDAERGDHSISFDSPAAGNFSRDSLSGKSIYFGALIRDQIIWLRKH